MSVAALHALYRRLDVYVSPHCARGFGQSILEAMFLKVPAVITDVGGIASNLQHDKNVLFIASEEEAKSTFGRKPKLQSMQTQMKRLYEDDALRKRIGEEGSKFAAGYTFDLALGKIKVALKGTR
jgi:glycosyltransferase involved in cell wall biosynthesis